MSTDNYCGMAHYTKKWGYRNNSIAGSFGTQVARWLTQCDTRPDSTVVIDGSSSMMSSSIHRSLKGPTTMGTLVVPKWAVTPHDLPDVPLGNHKFLFADDYICQGTALKFVLLAVGDALSHLAIIDMEDEYVDPIMDCCEYERKKSTDVSFLCIQRGIDCYVPHNFLWRLVK